MPGAGWETVPLPEVLEFREGPGILARDFVPAGVPLIRLAGLKRGAGLLDGCNYLDPGAVARRWRRFQVAAGDVLLSASASLGEVAVVGPEAAGAVPYTGIIALRPASAAIEPAFVAHALAAPGFRAQIEAMGAGSVLRHFGPTHLRRMTVELPPPGQQAGIAAVLGALDARLAASARIAATCDALRAAALARALAERPGPRAPLSALAAFVNGRPYTRGASGTGRLVIRIAELTSGPGPSTVRSDADVPAEHLAGPGDVLFAWSGSLTVARWYRPAAIVNQHIFKVIPAPGVPRWLIHDLIAARLPVFRAIAADQATTLGHIRRRHLDEPVPVPAPGALAALDAALAPLWHRALAAERERLTLTRLRDAAAARLLAGQLTVDTGLMVDTEPGRRGAR
jgi:type I restriction enzyme, S subunit